MVIYADLELDKTSIRGNKENEELVFNIFKTFNTHTADFHATYPTPGSVSTSTTVFHMFLEKVKKEYMFFNFQLLPLCSCVLQEVKQTKKSIFPAGSFTILRKLT